jgi:hypothetical protein
MDVLAFVALVAFAVSAVLAGIARNWPLALLAAGLGFWLLAGSPLVD